MILIVSIPASIKFCFAIAAVAGQPSIVTRSVFLHEAAIYIVLIPREVPNSIIKGLPNSAAIFDRNLPYLKVTGEFFAISDTRLRYPLDDSEREPRS